ncbi:MAG: Ig-like domain-containing protein, partial [Acidimicrobiales bacterium]
GNYTLTISYAGSATLASASLSTPFVIGTPTALVYTGSQAGAWGRPALLRATLTDPASGQAIAGEPVGFSLGGGRTGAITDASGIAEVSFSPSTLPGSYTLVASFAGGDGYAPVVASVPFRVEAHATTLSYSGPASATWGQPVALSATLADATAGGGIPGETVTFALGSQSVSAITNKHGIARATLTPAQTPSEATCEGRIHSSTATCITYDLAVSFAGSPHYASDGISSPFAIDWPYAFVDASGQGTIYLNPVGRQLLFVGTSPHMPTQVVGPVSVPDMTTVTWAGSTGVTDVTYSSSAIGLQGEFSLTGGVFSAVVDTASHLYTLEAGGTASGTAPGQPAVPPNL